MAAPTRSKNGISTADNPGSPLWSMPNPDPTRLVSFFEDFCSGATTFPIATTGLAAASAGGWTITVTEAGAGDAASAFSGETGGALTLTCDAADNDNIFVQKKPAAFTLAAGKKAFFKARFKVSDATQSDFVIGLQVIDTTPLAVTDGIYFQKDDGDAQLDVYCQKDASTGQTSATNIATIADSTYLTVGWYYDGISSVRYYVNDVHKGTLDGSSTYLPDTVLAVSFGIQNGEAVAKVMTVDYIIAAVER